MNKISKYLFAMLAILAISCNDKPSDMAINLLPDTVSIKGINSFDTLLIPSIRVYRAHYPLFNYGSIFIGKANGLTALTLTNFAYLPDTLGNLTEDKIEKVELTMHPERYALGDTNSGNLAFDIYRVERRWNIDTTNYDSLTVSPANYFGEKIGSYSGKITLKDTLDPIKLQLPKNLIIDWLRTEMVYDSAQKKEVPKVIPNWGIAFVPQQNATVINRFAGNSVNGTTMSTIYVDYKDNMDSTRTLKLAAGIDMTFIDVPEQNPDDIVIFNGVNYWTEINFDLSMIPQFSGIHKAQLDLFLDKSKSFAGNTPLDTIIEANYFMDKNATSTFQYLSASDGNGKYRFNSITSSVQLWNKGNGRGSIVVMPHNTLNQAKELDKLVFFGLNAVDSTKRPTLRVIYSLNPANFKEK